MTGRPAAAIDNTRTDFVAGSVLSLAHQCIFIGLDGNNHDLVSGPVGPGGANPIIGYAGNYDQNPGGGPYTIFLTGATVAVVPEEGTARLRSAGARSGSRPAADGPVCSREAAHAISALRSLPDAGSAADTAAAGVQ